MTTAAERIDEAATPRPEDFPGDPVAAFRLRVPDRAHGQVPEVSPAVYHGLVGDVVRTLAPHTEADPVALLVTLLAAGGAMAGNAPHIGAGGSRHGARVWPLLVGETAAGRKGTAWAVVRNFVQFVDAEFAANNINSGLSSGEGLIYAVRDAPPRDDPPPGEGDKRRERDADPGVSDKRLLVVESEFARILNTGKREGNTLSQVLRDCWDGGTVGVMTRKDPLRATNAHIVVTAHISPRELNLRLTEGDVAGGLLNRFLPVLVHRSRLMPDSSDPDPRQMQALAHRFAVNLDTARTLSGVPRTDDFRRQWRHVYTHVLNPEDIDDGLTAKVVARASAQVLRLALTYALCDGARHIDEPHLSAACALWRYVQASAERLFGDLSGQAPIDTLKRALSNAGDEGMTRSEMSALFGRNKSAAQLQAMYDTLTDARAAEWREGPKVGPGRPPESLVWIAAPL